MSDEVKEPPAEYSKHYTYADYLNFTFEEMGSNYAVLLNCANHLRWFRCRIKRRISSQPLAFDE